MVTSFAAESECCTLPRSASSVIAVSNLSTGTRSTSVDRLRSPCRSCVLRSLSMLPPRLTSRPSTFARAASRSFAVSAISPVLITERTVTTVRFAAGPPLSSACGAEAGPATSAPLRLSEPPPAAPSDTAPLSALIESVPPPLQAAVSTRSAVAAPAAATRVSCLVMPV